MKLYTVESMSVNGSYGLKSVQDTQETPEDELRRRNARKYKAEYRARQKGGVAASSPPTVPSVTVISTAKKIVPSSKKRSLSPISRKRRKITVTTPGACEIHNDLDCTDQGCVSDFFEDYDPFDEGFEVRSEPRRSQPGTKYAPPQRTVPEQQSALDSASKKTLREVELAISLVARDGRQRRPYITHNAREFVRHMGGWFGFSGYVDCIIHVDFTPAEAEALRFHISKGVPAFNDMPIDQEIGYYASLSMSWPDEVCRFLHSLPGRIESDVTSFIEECKAAFMNRRSRPLGQFIIRVPRPFKRTTVYPRCPPELRLRLLRETGKSLVSWGGLREPGRAMELRIRDTMPAWKVFTEGSSDIMDVCWSPGGQRFGLACCTFDDQYNRPGNLMLGSLDSLKIRMLDGHKVPRQDVAPQAVLDPYLYSTVTSVKYSRGGQLLFSGSYDETVKIWLGEDGTLLNSINLGSAVLHLATSPVHQHTIAAGCKDGNVSLLHMDSNGNLEIPPVVFRPAKQNLEAATLAWCSDLRPNWLIAGYDNRLEKGNSGDLLIFDIKAEKVASNVMPGSTRQFDVFLDERGSMFATAAVAGASRAGKHIKTQIRLYNLDGNVGRNTRAICEFDCEQCDINKVTVSACEAYVTASGTDGSTTVWDRRNPNNALHILKHGNSLMVPRIDGNPEIDDTGVTCAFWGPTNDRFYTGGSDGVLKIWDIKRGDPFIRDFATLDSQIMSGAFSPDYNMLILGESSGKATLFSTRGDRGVAPGLFDVDISDVTGDVSEEKEETGAEAARELVKSGKMIIRDHFAWATGL
ncbi:WD40 repeat-like protein [Wilcoxina mikolae CBS 423.85]|nr:WD40 repeat-like protein [Wilcoxina mikolae CBS 423.85]